MIAKEENETWDLVPLPNEKKAVGCFYSETYLDSSLARWKARLVAKGYSKMNGVNY